MPLEHETAPPKTGITRRVNASDDYQTYVHELVDELQTKFPLSRQNDVLQAVIDELYRRRKARLIEVQREEKILRQQTREIETYAIES